MALLVVPATFITIGVLLVKGLNANQKGLEILLDIQWDTLWKLDVSLLDIFIYKWSMIILYLYRKNQIHQRNKIFDISDYNIKNKYNML